MLQLQESQGLDNVPRNNIGHILTQHQQMSPFNHTFNKEVCAGNGVFLPNLSSGGLLMQSEEAVANKHAIAERNRRKRINAHLNTLRKLFPNLPKSDKSRVLKETVNRLKELRRNVADRYSLKENGGGPSLSFLPGENDELNVSYCGGDDGEEGRRLVTVKAVICCEDRPRLNGELTEAVKSVNGKVVRAEMATVGGRTKAVLVVRCGGGAAGKEVGSLTRALKAVVENKMLGCSPLLGSSLVSPGTVMISQFFVLSQRGDNIVFRDYRGDIQKGSAETFFRKVKFWSEDGEEEAPPVFNVDGVNYFHVKVAGLLFVATTRTNIAPSLILELLQRIARVIKDYLGILNEDSLRKNFVLVYELLDEVIDFGYVQTTSTEVLKSYVFNEPIVIDAARLPSLGPASMFMQGNKRMPGTAITKSVVANEPGGRKREEIFVDIIEKISVTFSSSGYILTSEIDGTIQMKSYLTGNPEIKLALNDDLTIGRGGNSVYGYGGSSGSGPVILDDCNFHESVHLDSFDVDRTLYLVPPDGEFPVMNYRITQEFKPPFRINALIEEAGPLKAEVILKIRAEFPSTITANTIAVQMPLPKYTMRVSFELEPGVVGQTTDFKESNKRMEWNLKKIAGGSEHTLRAKLTFSQELHGNITKEAGPVSMNFTIPMHNPSRLQVKYLQIAKKAKGYNPYRWVRYVTQANSYVARI
ncbi:OLC1v1017235C1 [Oldenlandia corymbosa var. corymbosa]|uniref:OLC1v1017235C1 n=1 Tax=Oldenlandia corymbosa var. corymbosa TaxID=529605 RepID=A0AAV1E954_OLDCO|nr:OLC1v1017235C1 [Oldenlandia corymbosa var. corymbosa]